MLTYGIKPEKLLAASFVRLSHLLNLGTDFGYTTTYSSGTAEKNRSFYIVIVISSGHLKEKVDLDKTL